MVKHLIIADEHKEYVDRLSAYILKVFGDDYEVEVFYDKNQLKERIKQCKCDVLLISTQLYDSEINFKNIKLPIILSEENPSLPNVETFKWTINKYTRITSIIKYIDTTYEEVEQNRPIIYSFYAPAGGVGKTSMALATAIAYTKIGKKVLYINLEDIDSTGMFFKEKNVNVNIPLENPIKNIYDQILVDCIKKDELTDIMYLKRKYIDEMSEVKEHIALLVEKMIDNDIANIIIIDLSTNYNQLSSRMSKISDYIILVSSMQTHSVYKLKQLLKELHLDLELKEKLKLILNQSKEFNFSTDIEIIGRIGKLNITTPLGLCEYIAQNQLLKLHGLVLKGGGIK